VDEAQARSLRKLQEYAEEKRACIESEVGCNGKAYLETILIEKPLSAAFDVRGRGNTTDRCR
jgi:hypothetical protein